MAKGLGDFDRIGLTAQAAKLICRGACESQQVLWVYSVSPGYETIALFISTESTRKTTSLGHDCGLEVAHLFRW